MISRRFALVCLIPLSWLIACSENQPIAPDIDAQFGVGGGSSSLKAPSNTNAAAVSESRVDVSWRDNSPNEAGFEVHRSTTGPSGAFSWFTSTGAGASGFSDTRLTPSTQYCYQVRAFRNAGGKTSYSAFANIACAATLSSAPTSVVATVNRPNGSGIGVSWTDNAATENGFRVERSATTAGPWTSIGTTGANVVSFQDGSPPAAEQPACYRVFATTSFGDSPSSTIDCTTIPAGPSGAVAVASGADVDVVWTDNSTVEDGFQVVRNGIVVATLAANTTTYRDDALAEGNYSYRVRATKDIGTSRESNEATVGVFSAPPTAPVCLYAVPRSSSFVEVLWCDVSTAEGFRVERSTDGGGGWVTADTTGAGNLSFYDTGLPSEYEVCYRVIAFNDLGESQASDVDCTTPPAGPSGLGLFTDEDGMLVLFWTDNSAIEDGYEAFGCFDGGCDAVALPPDSTSWRVPWAPSWYYFDVVATKDGGYSDRAWLPELE